MSAPIKPINEIIDHWHGKFSKMRVGEAIEIGVVGKRDPETFTDICKLFIAYNPDFELTNDYKFLKRISPWPDNN
ncbi:MAG: hypothetical protein JWR05_3511 [Mucilaginibacter sp.]|nr:hypothetical protein [Mucilaginibacter sp.]